MERSQIPDLYCFISKSLLTLVKVKQRYLYFTFNDKSKIDIFLIYLPEDMGLQVQLTEARICRY